MIIRYLGAGATSARNVIDAVGKYTLEHGREKVVIAEPFPGRLLQPASCRQEQRLPRTYCALSVSAASRSGPMKISTTRPRWNVTTTPSSSDPATNLPSLVCSQSSSTL